MKKRLSFISILAGLLCMVGTKTFAHDIAVENADGVTIYYNYINDNTELEVTYRGNDYDSYSDRYANSVIIPESVTILNRTLKVTSIGHHAFYRCNGLTSITIPESVKSIGNIAFHDCDGLTSVTIPEGVKSIGSSAFGGCSGLASITIPEGVTSIQLYTFQDCSGLTSITIPSSVTGIGYYAFYRCSSLTSVIIPESVTDIGGFAFEGCSSLTSITIPSNVTNIGKGTFSGCSGLASITIPSNVTSIDDNAFEYCSSLTSITIPNSVTSIGFWAFGSCDNLTTVVSLIEEPFSFRPSDSIYSPFSQFTYTNSTLYVPQGTIEKYKATEGWNSFSRIEEGMPSAINTPRGEDTTATEVQRYTLGGQHSAESQRGLNIVKMSDGTTKKVIVK